MIPSVSNFESKVGELGEEAYHLARELFPICRSITGQGVRDTLGILTRYLEGAIRICEVPSGEKVFDWKIPQEWNISDAYIIAPDGRRLAEFSKCNLHVVNYSQPVDKVVSLEELQRHLYSLPSQPSAIPYVTSYYREEWGFCIEDEIRKTLQNGHYRVVIDSEFKEGSLTYGEVVLPGKSNDEIFFSTYVCHPSLANNEISGPALAAVLIRALLDDEKERKFTYRFLFAPETIGAITYIARNPEVFDGRVKAAFNLTCVGDDRQYSFLPSKWGTSLSDAIGQHVLHHLVGDYKKYSFRSRGSDERQFCWPGIDLPMVSLMRSKYGEYPEYHTSLDNLSVISPKGFSGSLRVFSRCIEALEQITILHPQVTCEPQLSKRDLYSSIGGRGGNKIGRKICDLLIYSDGEKSTLDIADLIDCPIWELYEAQNIILKEGLAVSG